MALVVLEGEVLVVVGLLFKETAKGILSILFGVGLFFFSIERLNVEKLDWYLILFRILIISFSGFGVIFLLIIQFFYLLN